MCSLRGTAGSKLFTLSAHSTKYYLAKGEQTENNDNGTTYIVLLSPKWYTNQSLISEPYIDGITASEWRKRKTNQIMLKLAKKIQNNKCTCGEPIGDDFYALRQANTAFGNKKVMYELLRPKCYEKRKVNGKIRPTQEL